jgi:hypothetical protein
MNIALAGTGYVAPAFSRQNPYFPGHNAQW